MFVQDSWRPTGKLTVEGGLRYVLWPPWHSLTNNIATFNPAYYDKNNTAIVNPATGAITGGPRYNGILLPGDGFPSSASNLAVYNDPAVKALFKGAPEGLSKTQKNVFEPRVGVAYAWNDKTILKMSAGVFHNRAGLNDSILAGRQSAVPAAGQRQQRLGRQPRRRGRRRGAAARHDRRSIRMSKVPAAYTFSGGVQRQLPLGFVLDANYVHREGRNLQREININQLRPGTVQANPGINSAALRPYLGYGVIRQGSNTGSSKYNSLQLGADRRYKNGFKFGAAYTLSHSDGQREQQARPSW